MYKITFEMISPICYTELPIFDSIIAFCEYCEKHRMYTDSHSPIGHEVLEFDIPIQKHSAGFYLASYLCFSNEIEGVDSWKKRWHEKDDNIVHFGKGKRRVHTGMGEFKNFDMPMVIHSVKEASFYFDGDKDYIEYLVCTHLTGLGKKTSMGFGWFKSLAIEKSCEKEKLLYRPLPFVDTTEKINGLGINPANYVSSFGSYRLPYWKPEYKEKILIP